MFASTLDAEHRRYANQFLHESEENKALSIREIKKWLCENPKINGNEADYSILAFLRCCKFDIERTKIKMKDYYAMRSETPEWFTDRNPNLTTVQELVKLGVFVPLKQMHQNQHVIVIRTAAHDPNKHSQDDVFKVGMMILDLLAQRNELLQIYGVIAIFDMKNVTAAHALELPPHKIKKIVRAWRNYHCKPKRFEFVNAPLYIGVVLNIFKNFMTDKMKNRVKVHFSGYESLHEVVSKDILPVELGGTDGNIQELANFWSEELIKHAQWFEEDAMYKSHI